MARLKLDTVVKGIAWETGVSEDSIYHDIDVRADLGTFRKYGVTMLEWALVVYSNVMNGMDRLTAMNHADTLLAHLAFAVARARSREEARWWEG